jgi:hypothetical protein
MSEPTGEGTQQPDPSKGKDPESDRGEIDDQTQDVTPDPVFSDPTAPVWADPTAPIPPGPSAPPPPGPTPPQGDQPAAGPASPDPQPTPPAAPPESNPYAQQPPVQPYGEPTPGQPQPGQQYQAYGQPYAATPPTPANGSAIALTIVSGVSVLFCNLLAIASLVLGIIALTKNRVEPESSKRLTKTGWIVFGVVWALAILLFVGYIALFAASFSSSSFNSGF